LACETVYNSDTHVRCFHEFDKTKCIERERERENEVCCSYCLSVAVSKYDAKHYTRSLKSNISCF